MRLRPVPFALLAVSAAALSACNPSWMPTGYAHTNDYYKAPAGPAAPDIGYPYTAVDNAAAVQHWEFVAERLVQELHKQLGLAGQPVFVAMLPDQNAFNASFDFALRDVLRRHGYTLALSERNVLKLEPELMRTDDWKETSEAYNYNGDDKATEVPRVDPVRHPYFILGLIASRNGIPVGEVRDNFHPPRYGYMNGTGVSDWAQFYGEHASHSGGAAEMIPPPCTSHDGTGPQPCAPVVPHAAAGDAPVNVLPPATPGAVTQEQLDDGR